MHGSDWSWLRRLDGMGWDRIMELCVYVNGANTVHNPLPLDLKWNVSLTRGGAELHQLECESERGAPQRVIDYRLAYESLAASNSTFQSAN